MPDRPGHQRRAQENEALFQELQGRQTRLFDWEVTTLFYAALHWVHAYLATVETPLGVHQPEASPGGHHPKTHRLTRSMMSHEPNLRNILDDYWTLKDRSEDARYRLLPISGETIQEMFENEYTQITSTLAALLGLSRSQ